MIKIKKKSIEVQTKYGQIKLVILSTSVWNQKKCFKSYPMRHLLSRIFQERTQIMSILVYWPEQSERV